MLALKFVLSLVGVCLEIDNVNLEVNVVSLDNVHHCRATGHLLPTGARACSCFGVVQHRVCLDIAVRSAAPRPRPRVARPQCRERCQAS